MFGVTKIEDLINGIGSSLQDTSGGQSNMRLMGFMWVCVLCAGVGLITFKTDKFPDLPDSIVYVTGIMIAGKWLQKREEVKAAVPPVQ